MKHSSAFALAFALLAARPFALPQDAAPTLTARSTLVLVPALVRTRNGDLVYTLTADDFVLSDDGVPQKLILEQDTGGEPLALVVAVEVGGAGARELNKLGPLAPMIGSVVGNVPHRVAVVAFDSQPRLQQDFTADIDAAASTLRALGPGDNGAAILDTLGFSVDLLRKQPPGYRRAILMMSETIDRGSQLKLEEALRAISDTNTAIYSIGFSTGKSEAAHYAARELPTQSGGLGMENPNPNPPGGCMGKDPNPDPDATHSKSIQVFDCLTQLAPPLALAKMAAIAMTDALRRNVLETVAHVTGGEYFKLTNAKSLERSLATISNHVPNRYILSFQPQSPHAGLHAIDLHLLDSSDLHVTARGSYWADSTGKASP